MLFFKQLHVPYFIQVVINNIDECILLAALYAYTNLTDHKLHIVCDMLH